MGVDNTEIFNEIFDRKLLSVSFKELAEAIIMGKKCNVLSESEVKKSTDKIVATMIVYYGQRVSDAAIEEIKDKCPLELKKYHSYLTIQEVMVGVGMAMRDKFGEVKYQRVSLKLLTELLGKYESSDMRHRVIKVYNDVRDEHTARPLVISYEEQERLCYNLRLLQFEKFKSNGIQSVIITHRDYDYLLDKCGLPDYKEFLIEAGKIVCKPLKAQSTIAEVIDKAMSTKIIYEAKRMAVIKQYTTLVSNNISLKEYMKTT